jgi:hypothetical protein
MKKMFVLMLLSMFTSELFLKNVEAQELTAVRNRFQVVESYCGEIDPFLIGDACVLKLKALDVTKDHVQLLFLIDQVNFEETFTDLNSSNSQGRVFEVNFALIAREMEKKEIEELGATEFCLTNNCSWMEASGLTLLSSVEASTQKMDLVVKKMGDNFTLNPNQLPKDLLVKMKTTLLKQKTLEKALEKHLAGKLADWKKYVYQSGEFDHLSKKQKKKIANDPLKNYFKTEKSLLEIEVVSEIYTEANVLVGYFIKVSDHLQAAMYQDGAWLEIYLDVNQDTVAMMEQAS